MVIPEFLEANLRSVTERLQCTTIIQDRTIHQCMYPQKTDAQRSKAVIIVPEGCHFKGHLVVRSPRISHTFVYSSQAKMSHSESVEGEDSAVSSPLVFSCVKCKTIVGDSFSFLSSSAEAKTITTSAASNIQRSTELYTSYASLDEGSTYFCFLCSQCQQPLGRYYVTTSKDLDHVREKFTFNIDEITSYELGKAQHGKMPEPIEVSAAPVDMPVEESDTKLVAVQEDVDKVCNGV